VIPDQIVTRQVWDEATLRNGEIVADPERDLVKLAVAERHRATGRVGLGIVRGLGLQAGAIASSIGHDAHNLIVAGSDDGDMLAALRHIVDLDGGLAVVSGGVVRASLQLDIAGLMSTRPLSAVVEGLRQVEQAARDLGCRLEHPLMSISFLALSVIPELKLTDQGLVDVKRSTIVPIQD
jgi:adenine deaminase